MDHLRRHLAPVTEAAWGQIEDEAKRSLRLYLGARRLVDVAGPFGWDTDAAVTGDVAPLADGPRGVRANTRRPLALVELRTPFTMSLADMDLADRGNTAIDTDPVIAAARTAALAEDGVVFNGLAGSPGIVDATPLSVANLPADAGDYPIAVAQAVRVLRDAGIGGPYAVALGDAEYTAATETTEKGGYPVVEHLARLLDGPVQWVPALSGAVVLSIRGGDYRLTLGQDFSIGYTGTDGDEVSLYLEESVAFQSLTPNAAVRLAPARSRGKSRK